MSDGAEPDASNIIVVPPGACMSLPMSASTILLSVGVSSKRSDWAFRLPKMTVLMKKDIFIILVKMVMSGVQKWHVLVKAAGMQKKLQPQV